MRGLIRGLGLILGVFPYHGLPALGSIDLNTNVFVTGATLGSTTGTENARTDDYGLLRADDILETNVTGAFSVAPAALSSPLVNGTQYTADLIVKPFGRTCCLFQVSGTTNNAYVCVDLVAKTAGTQTGITGWSVTDIANGFKQVRIVFTATASEAVGVTIFTATNNTTFSGIVGDISKGLTLARATISH